MLKKKYRLKSNSSFVATYFQNKVVSDEFFVLYAGKKREENFLPKIGFVVNKKVNKRACVRNKIKRRLRAAFYFCFKDKEENIPYMSLIFKAKENSINANYLDCVKSVNNLVKKMANKFI